MNITKLLIQTSWKKYNNNMQSEWDLNLLGVTNQAAKTTSGYRHSWQERHGGLRYSALRLPKAAQIWDPVHFLSGVPISLCLISPSLVASRDTQKNTSRCIQSHRVFFTLSVSHHELSSEWKKLRNGRFSETSQLPCASPIWSTISTLRRVTEHMMVTGVCCQRCKGSDYCSLRCSNLPGAPKSSPRHTKNTTAATEGTLKIIFRDLIDFKDRLKARGRLGGREIEQGKWWR